MFNRKFLSFPYTWLLFSLYVLIFNSWSYTLQQKEITEYAQQQGYGYKAANLIVLDRLFSSYENLMHEHQLFIRVPDFVAVSHDQIISLLKMGGYDVEYAWHDVIAGLSQRARQRMIATKQLSVGLRKQLSVLGERIKHSFQSLARRADIEFPSNVIMFIERASAIGWQLMVRSTGREDTQELANAGGNHTEINVKPTVAAILSGIGQVVASYVSEKSLQQRLSAGDITIFDSPLMPVLLQRMIGEIAGGPIPIGCVAYSRDPAVLDNEISVIQATYGHTHGIVTSQVPVDTFYVASTQLISTSVSNKKMRFAPDLTHGQKIVLRENEMSISSKQSLTMSEVCFIHKITQLVHRLYGAAMDLELVYLPHEKTIYLVQARPLVLKTIKQQPSYFAEPDQIPAGMKLTCTTVSFGDGCVRQCLKSSAFLVADTLEQALDRYNASRNQQAIVAVIIKYPAALTSHAAATFRGEGKMIMQCSVYDSFVSWLTEDEGCFALDPQRGLLVKMPLHEEVFRITQGWLRYPLTLPLSMCVPLGAYVEKVVIDEECISTKSFTELFNDIAYGEKISAEKALKTLVQHIQKIQTDWHIWDVKYPASALLLKPYHEQLAALHEVMQYWYHAGMTLCTLPAGSVKRLYLARIVEAIMTQSVAQGVVGAYSLVSLCAERQSVVRFYEQRIVPLLTQGFVASALRQDESLMGYLIVGLQSFFHEAYERDWVTFLNQISALATSHDKQRMLSMLDDLCKHDLFSTWLNTSFVYAYGQSKDVVRVLATLCSFYDQNKEALKEVCAVHDFLLTLERRAYQEPSKIIYAIEQFTKQVLSSSVCRLFSLNIQQQQSVDGFMPLVYLSCMARVIDVFDQLLKSLKASTCFTSQRAKIAIFKRALLGYTELLSWLLDNEKFINRLKQLIETRTPQNKQLMPSKHFDVRKVLHVGKCLAAGDGKGYRLGSMIKTLEDAFTSIHQLALQRLSALTLLWQQKIQVRRPIFIDKVVAELGFAKQLTSVAFSREQISYHYHKELRVHSIALCLSYIPAKKTVNVDIRFAGCNEFCRWDVINDYLHMLAYAYHLPLPVVQLQSSSLHVYWPDLSDVFAQEKLGPCLKDIIDITFVLSVENERCIYTKAQALLHDLYSRLAWPEAAIDFLSRPSMTTSEPIHCLLVPLLKQGQVAKNNLLRLLPALKKILCERDEDSFLFGMLIAQAILAQRFAGQLNNNQEVLTPQDCEHLYYKTSLRPAPKDLKTLIALLESCLSD